MKIIQSDGCAGRETGEEGGGGGGGEGGERVGGGKQGGREGKGGIATKGARWRAKRVEWEEREVEIEIGGETGMDDS